jgi:hypothetical protein
MILGLLVRHDLSVGDAGCNLRLRRSAARERWVADSERSARQLSALGDSRESLNMSVFQTPGRLASWTGVCPGSNESAGRIKSAHILPGNKYLKASLGAAACPRPGPRTLTWPANTGASPPAAGK